VKDIHNLFTLLTVVRIVEYRTVIGRTCSFSGKSADVWNVMVGKFLRNYLLEVTQATAGEY